MTRPTQYVIKRISPTVHNPSVICENRSFTYAQFLDAVIFTSRRFQDTGIREHDRVGILSHNSADYLFALFALWRIGAVACLLSPRLPDKALKEQMRSIGCQRLLTASDLGAVSIPVQDIHSDDQQDLSVSIEQDATIMFTSGTSSKPKAVLHTFSNHYYSAKGSNEHLPVIPGDQWLLSLPLYHVGGLGIVMRAFLGGGTVVIPGLDEGIDRMLRTQKITHLSLVPTQLIRLLRDTDCRRDLKALKVILLGGSAVPEPVINDAVKLGLPVYTTYGSTEMASQVATSGRLSEEFPVSAGKILNYRQLMISETCEILVKGETLFKGYVENSGLCAPFDKNGYFSTGDLGTFLDNGSLSVKGRKDNMFISGGENIQPEEIERYLCRIKNIERAVVVPVLNEEFGLRPIAVIQPSGTLTRQRIRETLENDLPKFKVPDQFYLWPKNADTCDWKAGRLYFADLLREQPSALIPIT